MAYGLECFWHLYPETDYLGTFRKSAEGKKYLVAAIQQVTKWVKAKAVSSDSAEESAKLFVDQTVCRFGVPRPFT